MGTETCECGRLFPNMPNDYEAHRTTCMYARIADLQARLDAGAKENSKLLLQIEETRKIVERLATLCGRIIHDRACVCNEPGHRCGTNLMMEDLSMVLDGFEPARLEEITKNVMAYAKGLLALKRGDEKPRTPGFCACGWYLGHAGECTKRKCVERLGGGSTCNNELPCSFHPTT